MTKTEAAQRLGVTRETLYKWIRKGDLTPEVDGSISEADVMRLLERQPSRQADTAKRLDTMAALAAAYEAHIATLRHELALAHNQIAGLQTAFVALTSGRQQQALPSRHEPLTLAANDTLDMPPLQAIQPAEAPLGVEDDLATCLDTLESSVTTTGTMEARILAYLQAHPEEVIKAEQMAVILGTSNIRSVSTLLGRLTKKGVIARFDTGVYGVERTS